MLLKLVNPTHEPPPSLEIRTSTLSSDPRVPGVVLGQSKTPKSNSNWKGPPLLKLYCGDSTHSFLPRVYKLIFTAPVVPTFPKPSVNHELVPNPVGPVDGSPSPAWFQHVFGGNPAVKSSNDGATIAEHGVEKVYGPAQ